MSRLAAAYPTLFERLGVAVRGGGASLSVGIAGLTAYLWAVHSFDAPIAIPAMVVAAVAAFASPGGVRFPVPLLWFGAWLAWCAVGVTTTSYPGTVTGVLWDYAKIGVLLFITVNVCRTPNQLAFAAAAWLALFVLYPMRGTYLNFATGYSWFGRYFWNRTFGQPNDLAAFTLLAIGLTLFLLQLRMASRLVRLGLFATLGGLVLLIFLTQSRGGFLALAIATLVYLASSRKRFQYLLGAVAVAVLVAVFAPGEVWSRFRGIRDLSPSGQLSQVDASADQRYTIQLVALAMVQDHPLYGVGVGAYSLKHEQDAAERKEWYAARGPRDTHNMYLNLAAETGLPGLALFVGMLATTLLHAVRAERRMRVSWPQGAEALRALRFGLIAFLLAAILGTFHRASFLFVYVGLVVAAGSVMPTLAATQGSGMPLPGTPGSPRRRWGARRTTPVPAAALVPVVPAMQPAAPSARRGRMRLGVMRRARRSW